MCSNVFSGKVYQKLLSIIFSYITSALYMVKEHMN